MNLEFHYYIVYFLCKESGFSDEESQIIAYSSQFVDNNLIGRKIKIGTSIYETIPTQNYGWWDDYYPNNVYIPFHFFPGDLNYPDAKRKDGMKNPLNCTPGSQNVKQLLIEGLKTRNLYRVGIAIHTYADSWAHQNFSGMDELWNKVDENSIIPNIGHAQVLSKPDGLTASWEDSRLVADNERIENRERFYKAAGKIYKYLRTYNRKSFKDSNLIIEKLKMISGIYDTMSSTTQDRIYNYIIDENIYKYDKYEWYKDAVYDPEISEDDANGLVGYDKFLWVKDAILSRLKLVEKPLLKARDNFFKSHYYKWNEAAKEHLKTAKSILKDFINL